MCALIQMLKEELKQGSTHAQVRLCQDVVVSSGGDAGKGFGR
jgi:hypothetical protein